MPATHINRTPLPDAPQSIELHTNDGQTIGVLRFTTKSGTTTSVLEYAPGQTPHRRYPLRAKHRQQ